MNRKKNQIKEDKSLIKRLIPQNKEQIQKIIIIVISFILAYFIIIFSTQFWKGFNTYNLEDFAVGQVAPEDFVVQRTIRYVDEEATQQEIEHAEDLVPPVFHVNEGITKESLSRFDIFRENVFKIITIGDPVQTELLKKNLELSEILSTDQLKQLYALPNVTSVFDIARQFLSEILNYGILPSNAVDQKILRAGFIKIWRRKNDQLESEKIYYNKIIHKDNVRQWLHDRIKTITLEDEITEELLASLVSSFIDVNAFYDDEQTQANRLAARNNIKPITRVLKEGDIIIRQGETITEEANKLINIHGQYSYSVNINTLTGTAVLLLIIYALAFFLINYFPSKNKLEKEQLFLLLGIGLLYLILGAIFSTLWPTGDFPPFSVILPTAVVSILVTIIISANMGIIFSLILSLALLLIDFNITAFIFAFLSGTTASILASGASKRIDLVKTGIILSFFNIIILIGIGLFESIFFDQFINSILFGIGNGFFCGILSLGFLPIFEHSLNLPTCFRLLELADPNVPILKKMLVVAPGTYSHSISVANLAEAACEAIGANALLARVGAYYHDIGKIDQPEYFIENQQAGNKHDDLKPSLSAAVIKAHVKVGIEKAKELNLPQAVINIIAQHHGKTLITFFYHRALNKDAIKKKVSPNEYSYVGIRPKTKEAGVLMLADTVEAATRTLKRPTIQKLEKFIWSLILDKFSSGELSECDLTFNDLEITKDTFVKIIAAYLHTRIEYPKIKEMAK